MRIRKLFDPWTGSTEPYAGIKKAQQMAKGAADTASGTAAGYGAEAKDVGSTLVPALQQEVKAPTGISPTDLAAMETKGAEAAGGTNAAIAGEASNLAARTRNTGALSGVLKSAAMDKTRQLSTNALDVAAKNAQVKEAQRQAGLKGLEGLYGEDVSAQLKGEGLVPEDIKAWGDAGQTGWYQNVLAGVNAVKGSKGPMSYV